MDVVWTVMAALVSGAGGSFFGTWWSSRQLAARDTVSYRRKLQDESRERLREIYLDVLHAARGVRSLNRSLITLAYGRMALADRKKLRKRTAYWNERLDHIQRQEIRARLEGGALDVHELMQPWGRA